MALQAGMGEEVEGFLDGFGVGDGDGVGRDRRLGGRRREVGWRW